MPVDPAAITAAFVDAADYDTTGSCEKCRAFIAACRAMLVLPKSAGHGGEEISFDQATLRQLLQDAQAWAAEHCEPITTPTAAGTAGGGGAIHYDLRDYRR